ncbi:PREDICTED: melatonin receptor type 1A-like [Priapulus caudatus]|uniref:Melatonin receptor type 1A-like n=1 Tax=Priapulus caudatus TaxID=37621 RepID=A0ABM1DZX9_PRICU|nr:PREDICTED: melatonin receptor type 1A-like [Priapulus caudatus]
MATMNSTSAANSHPADRPVLRNAAIPFGQAIAYVVIQMIASGVGVIGNILVIGAVLIYKPLRKSGNIFIATLAIVDLCVTGYITPLGILGFFNQDVLTESPNLCTFTGAVCVNVCNASLFTLMIISVSRMFAISYPNIYARMFTPMNCIAVVVISWFVVIAVNLPAFFYSDGFWFEPRSQSCLWNWYVNPLHRHLWAVLCLIVPVIVTAACYLNIFIHVYKSKQRWQW